mmetsp:Transcript_18186/g.46015  ORF Transcript_18186/g.46015 Transcript_18186/m.46015 type:complete len:332 (-) Transcript_18186:246-1241(-)|eukprot:jgi/Tetstr1/463107/TSEL_008041.t1
MGRWGGGDAAEAAPAGERTAGGPDGRTNAKQWQHALAGGVAGLTSVLMLHPLDVVKTRLQVQDGTPRTELPAYRGMVDAMRSAMRTEGWRALYSGLSPALVGSAASWGIYFFAYNRAKERNRAWMGVRELSPGMNLLSAAQAGSLVCVLTNPLWVIKTRLQLQRGGGGPPGVNTLPAGAMRYTGLLHAVKCIAREEGLAGFYRGLGPSLLLVSHGAIQFMVYEELRRVATRGHSSVDQLGSTEISVMGAASKLAASLVTYPQQVIRSRLQQRNSRYALKYRTAWNTFKVTLRREGVPGLYKGLVPNVLRVMPSSAITFVVYENVIRMLSKL